MRRPRGHRHLRTLEQPISAGPGMRAKTLKPEFLQQGSMLPAALRLGIRNPPRWSRHVEMRSGVRPQLRAQRASNCAIENCKVDSDTYPRSCVYVDPSLVTLRDLPGRSSWRVKVK
jgi:hypothetical protein